MRRFRVGEVVLSVFCTGFAIASALAVTPNPKLLQLVPPTAQSVAGMSAPPRTGQPSSFLLITHNSTIDLNDFTTLSGVDNSHFVEQIIMVASDGGALTEHSLLASGRFDQGLIYRSAYRAAGTKAIQYRGISVLEIQPFARERASFHDVRWLAMMDGTLAVFGTTRLVQKELDRYLDHSVADPALQRRLAHLRRDDATWCVATLPENENEIQASFRLLDPRLADLLRAGDTLEFGTHYGRQVEFEYELSMAPGREAASVQRSLDEPATGTKGSSLLPVADLTSVDGGVRGALKVSMHRYEAWIAEVELGTELNASRR